MQEDLQRLSVYRSDDISQSLTIQQYPDVVTIPQDKANLHFEYDNGLRIYVPRDRRSFRLCLKQQLPLKFKSWLNISDPSAEANIAHVIDFSDDLELLDLALDEAGIVHVDGAVRSGPTQSWAEEVDGELDESFRAAVDIDNLSLDENGIDIPAASIESEALDATRNSTQRHPPSARVSSAHSRSASDAGRLTHTRVSGARSTSEFAGRRVNGASDVSPRSVSAFERVLDDTIQAAQRSGIPEKARLPSFAPRSTQSILQSTESNQAAFGLAVINGLRNRSRDCRVGAAGELYVSHSRTCIIRLIVT